MHSYADRGFDLYETPAVAVRALLAVQHLPHRIWEPAAGRGAIVQVLRSAGHKVAASDLIEYRVPGHASGRDFLLEKRAPPYCKCIVTNPPFQLAALFALHALTLVPKVCMLMRLAFLEAGNRDNVYGRARREVLDGGKLARVYVFKNRLPMMHRDGWQGKKNTSATAFAWFVWERQHRGATQLRRIAWEPL